MINRKQLMRETGNKFTKVMRVHRLVYDELTRQKKAMSIKTGADCVTFSQFLLECAELGDMLLSAKRFYLVENLIFKNIEDARGHAIVESVKSGRATPRKAKILMVVGADDWNGNEKLSKAK